MKKSATEVVILSFDPGTSNLGYAELRGNPMTSEALIGDYFGVFKTNKWEDGEEVLMRNRIDVLGKCVKNLVTVVKPDLIAMEDFIEQGKRVGKTYKEMASLTEHLRLVFRELGHEAMIYNNGLWKKKTLGATNASKVQVQHYVKHKIANADELLHKKPDHVWDSAGIGYCRWLDYLKENRGNTYECRNSGARVVTSIEANGSRRLLKRARAAAPKNAY